MKFKQAYNLILIITFLLIPLVALAENIDPDNDSSQYAWGENVGWINFEPSQGEGVTVTDSAVKGYAWGENIGWINLSPATGGVINDGDGNLSGFAWGENIGWINFAPNGVPVKTAWRGDTTPPSPSPMTWATQPYASSSTSISMIATTTTDSGSPPVSYYFDYVNSPTGGTGGTDSGWQSSTTYTDNGPGDGLDQNHQYGYRVKARDSAPIPNETAYSFIVYKYTLANAPGSTVFFNITQSSIQAGWTANGNRSGTEYYCENTTKVTNSGWTTNTSWNSTGLNCDTLYSFRVKAKNGDGIETGWTSLGSQSTTTCSTPNYTLAVSKNGTGSGTVTSTPAGINCGGTCSASFSSGTSVTLTPAAETGSIFTGWTGDGDCSDGAVTMSTIRNCTATFIVAERFPVYRFWGTSSHFYTISEADKAYVIATWPDIWHYEGIAYYAYPSQVSGTLPVYRFWGTTSHFYTISEADKAYVIATWPDVWHYEGIAYYAYPTQVPGTLPVYRFWGTTSHFYTISEADKAYVIATWPDIWHYEGIAFYAYPTP